MRSPWLKSSRKDRPTIRLLNPPAGGRGSIGIPAGIKSESAAIGNIPPAEAEKRYYAMLDDTPMAA
jgi:hypothetical protein